MRIRLIGAGIAAAAITLAPAVANGATYEKFTQTDPSGNAPSASDPSTNNDSVDIVKVQASRTASKLAIVVKYNKLKKSTYTRWVSALFDPSTGKGSALELRDGSKKGDVKATFYKLKIDSNGPTLTKSTCKGFSAKADYTHSQVVYSMPATCYPGSKDDGAFIAAGGAAWTKSTWTNGDLTPDEISGATADSKNEITNIWVWTSSTTMRAAVPRGFHLF